MTGKFRTRSRCEGSVCSAKLEGGDVEPARNTQVALVAVAQPIGKGQLVPVWQLHLEFVLSKATVNCSGRKGVREAGGTLEMGQGSARWPRRCQHCLDQGSLPPGLSL